MMYSVIRTQILFDPATYEALKRAAAARGMGLSALVRELVRGALGAEPKPRRRTRYGFTFVGIGRRETVHDVSERHDDYLNRGKRW